MAVQNNVYSKYVRVLCARFVLCLSFEEPFGKNCYRSYH